MPNFRFLEFLKLVASDLGTADVTNAHDVGVLQRLDVIGLQLGF